MIYLDWAATALPDTQAVEVALNSYKNHFANPSAIYSLGETVSSLLIQSRKEMGKNLNCQESKLFFCSSGTEANNIVISSLIRTKTPGSILVAPIEHDSVYKPIQNLKHYGWRIIEAPLLPSGHVDVNTFIDLIEEDTYAVFLMAICNENGAIQPFQQVGEEIAKINQKRSRKIRFHVDMVQALGKIPISLGDLEVDSVAFSGHKIGAIRGSGLLYLKKPLLPIYEGGGQEGGFRSGTENVGAIESLAFAIAENCKRIEENKKGALAIKKFLVESLTELEVPLLPAGNAVESLDVDRYSPYILQIAIPYLPSQVSVHLFSDNSIFLSGGSACSNNGKEKVSRISKNLKLPPKFLNSTLRISIGSQTSLSDAHSFINILKEKILPLAKNF